MVKRSQRNSYCKRFQYNAIRCCAARFDLNQCATVFKRLALYLVVTIPVFSLFNSNQLVSKSKTGIVLIVWNNIQFGIGLSPTCKCCYLCIRVFQQRLVENLKEKHRPKYGWNGKVARCFISITSSIYIKPKWENCIFTVNL